MHIPSHNFPAHFPSAELRLPPTSTTTPTPYVYTTAKPRRKATQSHIKAATFDVPKIKETVVTNHVQENEIAGAAFEGKYPFCPSFHSSHMIAPFDGKYLHCEYSFSK